MTLQEIYHALKRMPQLVMQDRGWASPTDRDPNRVTEKECIEAKEALEHFRVLLQIEEEPPLLTS